MMTFDNPGANVDYTNMVVADMVDILTSQKNPWPTNYTKRKKVLFLDKMISYLTEVEQYEACSKISALRERIIAGK